ncbi:PREDICTED: high affinity cAMP-specific 3',5'-cyclic phosphodiesterase 7A-like [Priapulus caudatus]|uniref:Phosphodiesterase n=1 Tax=Priapulus caudatus TaxID=37621 RepID=A0ABM1EM81_PRICU|nr:PREDICTED: high affinity cAMP-specific 3',5'-cyclic phosphodiesterase 7A-like [Priapulus caudatus]
MRSHKACWTMIPFTACLLFPWQRRPEQWQNEDQRRGGVSFDRTDKNAIYVRMLGDVKGRERPEQQQKEHRHPALTSEDNKLINDIDSREVTNRLTSQFHSLNRQKRSRCQPGDCKNSDSNAVIDEHYHQQVALLLNHVSNWKFNIFILDRITYGQSLWYICTHLFIEYGLVQHFHLDLTKVMKCFSLIAEGYHSNNPYHNATHAADVTQAMHCYLQEKKLRRSMSPVELMAALLAAVGHDLDHPGVNQAFLIATSNHLAALYKNSSVLENHHWRKCISILHECCLLDHLGRDDWEELRYLIRILILATDITRQQEFLTRFKKHTDRGDLHDLRVSEQRHFILQITLKCADISNPCRPWEISNRWSERASEEFYRQGDLEKKIGIPVTPLCDRMSTPVPKIQAGFMEFVVGPLFKLWQQFLPTRLSGVMVGCLETNKTIWQEAVRKADLEKDREVEKLRDNSPQASQTSSRRSSIDDDNHSDIISRKSSAELMATLENVSLMLLLGRRHSVPLSLDTHEMRLLAGSRRRSYPRAERTRWSVSVAKPTNLHSMPALNQLTDLILTVDSGVRVMATRGARVAAATTPSPSPSPPPTDGFSLQQPTTKVTALTSVYETSQLIFESAAAADRGRRVSPLNPPTVKILVAQDTPNHSESHLVTPSVHSDNRLSVDDDLLCCRRSSDPGQNKMSPPHATSPRRSSEPCSMATKVASGFVQRATLYGATCREVHQPMCRQTTDFPDSMRLASEYR